MYGFFKYINYVLSSNKPLRLKQRTIIQLQRLGNKSAGIFALITGPRYDS